MSYLSKLKSPDSSFFFKPITPGEVKQEILSVKNSLANVIKISAAILNLVSFSLFDRRDSDKPEMIHQGHEAFSEHSRGQQCTFMSLAALLFNRSNSVNLWTQTNIDDIW